MQPDIARIKELLAKATPGPWFVEDGIFLATAPHDCGELLAAFNQHDDAARDCGKTNAALIAELRNAAPALLDALDAAEARADKAEAELSAGSFYKESDIDALQDKAARAERAEAEVARLTEAAKVALNFIANSESELGIELDSGKKLRAGLEAKP